MKRPLFLATALAFATFSLPAFALDVAVTIKPLHSLVAGVMSGVGEPSLIVKGAGSPHDYHLRPSDAQNLKRPMLFSGSGTSWKHSWKVR